MNDAHMNDAYDLTGFEMTIEGFKALGPTHPRILIPVMGMRHCAKIFMIDLEYTSYVGQRPDDFQLAMLKWHEQPFAVISIPAADRRLADETAAQYGMRLADGHPYVVRMGQMIVCASARNDRLFPGKAERFLFHGPDVFTLEYDERNADYCQIWKRPASALRKREEGLIDRFFIRKGIPKPEGSDFRTVRLSI